ncbi:4-oxalocrotonate tautomerase family protein [Mycobacterium sp. pUA109]|uniref:4-oxalocrotonate tautomerase family protein n=1 Tax=Mycobacterium sp. pUA109 TaxID=3238982 RepID=UPI00351ACF63
MPYLRLTSPPIDAEHRRRLAVELTDLVVRLLTPPPGRGRPTADDMRARTTVHFTPYDPDGLAVGRTMLADTGGRDVTVEFSDWGLSLRRQQVIAREITNLLARLLDLGDDLDAVNVRFHRYRPRDFAVGGVLLAQRIPVAARVAKRLAR